MPKPLCTSCPACKARAVDDEEWSDGFQCFMCMKWHHFKCDNTTKTLVELIFAELDLNDDAGRFKSFCAACYKIVRDHPNKLVSIHDVSGTYPLNTIQKFKNKIQEEILSLKINLEAMDKKILELESMVNDLEERISGNDNDSNYTEAREQDTTSLRNDFKELQKKTGTDMQNMMKKVDHLASVFTNFIFIKDSPEETADNGRALGGSGSATQSTSNNTQSKNKKQNPKNKQDKQQKKTDDTVKNKTLAEVLSIKQKPSAERVKVVRITSDQLPAALVKIEKDDLLKSDAIKVNNLRAGTDFVCTFDSTEAAATFDANFAVKFPEIGNPTQPQNFHPSFKLVGAFHNISNENLLQDLADQNKQFNLAKIKFVTRYVSANSKAEIMICDTDIKTLGDLLSHEGGTVHNRTTVYHIFENCKFLQCNKCQNYGHLTTNCKSETDVCRICSDGHKTSECQNKATPKCINCMTSNKNNKTNYNVKHRATYDACPIRRGRIKKLKLTLSKKKRKE